MLFLVSRFVPAASEEAVLSFPHFPLLIGIVATWLLAGAALLRHDEWLQELPLELGST